MDHALGKNRIVVRLLMTILQVFSSCLVFKLVENRFAPFQIVWEEYAKGYI